MLEIMRNMNDIHVFLLRMSLVRKCSCGVFDSHLSLLDSQSHRLTASQVLDFGRDEARSARFVPWLYPPPRPDSDLGQGNLSEHMAYP